MKRRTKVFAFFGIVILGMLILTVLVKTKPKPGRSDAGPVKPLVETVQLTAGTVRVEIDATGTVQAAQKTTEKKNTMPSDRQNVR